MAAATEERDRPSASMQKADGESPADPGRRRGQANNADVRTRSGDGRCDIGGGHAMAARAAGDRRRVRRPVRRRGGPDVARERRRRRDVRRVDRPPRRPEPAADGQPGVHPPGAAASALEHIVGGADHDAARPRASSSRRRGGCTRTSMRSSRRRSTTAGSRPWPDTVATRRRWRRSRAVDGAGIRWLPVVHEGNGPRSRAGGRGGRRHRRASDRDDMAVTPTASVTAITLGRRHRGRAVQRPGRRDPGGARAGSDSAAGSGRSTSSRARKAPSASTRWRARAARTRRGT